MYSYWMNLSFVPFIRLGTPFLKHLIHYTDFFNEITIWLYREKNPQDNSSLKLFESGIKMMPQANTNRTPYFLKCCSFTSIKITHFGIRLHISNDLQLETRSVIETNLSDTTREGFHCLRHIFQYWGHWFKGPTRKVIHTLFINVIDYR